MYQKKCADARCRHVEYAVGDKALLLTRNLRLNATRKFRDHFVGLFVVIERIGNMAYCLDLLQYAALRGIHDVFHVSLLRCWLSNSVHADVLPIKIDGKTEYKATEIKGHLGRQGEMQYLTLFVGFDSSEDIWLSTAQLEHAPVLLQQYR